MLNQPRNGIIQGGRKDEQDDPDWFTPGIKDEGKQGEQCISVRPVIPCIVKQQASGQE
jgi:hypothetical protein